MKRSIPPLALTACLLAAAATRAGVPLEARLADAHNQSAFALYDQLTESGENLLLSPYSIGTAMAMARAGASGETREEMNRALHLEGLGEDIDHAQAAMVERMRALNAVDGIDLTTANGLALAAHGGMVADSFRDLLRERYEAEIFPAASIEPVNRWVKEKTRGKIPKIANSLPANPVCVILNAVYFNGLWDNPFDKKRTKDKPFYVAPETTRDVPMMHASEQWPAMEAETFRAVSLPYRDPALRMVLLVPKELDGLAATERELRDMGPKELLQKLPSRGTRPVKLALPRFTMKTDTQLGEAFKARGMRRAFSGENAEFDHLLGRSAAPGTVWIAKIVHKAMIDVSEEGTEAAAATGVVMATRCARPQPPMVVRADRPFAFLLVDRKSGMVLFMGRYAKPE